MSALTSCNQNSVPLPNSSPQKVSTSSSGPLEALVAGSAQRVISALPGNNSLGPEASIEGAYMTGKEIDSLCAEFGLGARTGDEEMVADRMSSSEAQALLLAYEGAPASSGSAAAALAEECRYPDPEVHSQEWVSDEEINLLLKELDEGVIDPQQVGAQKDRFPETEARRAKSKQLEEARKSEPSPRMRPTRLKVAPISYLVPSDVRTGFNRSSYRLSVVADPLILSPETVFGDLPPSIELRNLQKIRVDQKLKLVEELPDFLDLSRLSASPTKEAIIGAFRRSLVDKLEESGSSVVGDRNVETIVAAFAAYIEASVKKIQSNKRGDVIREIMDYFYGDFVRFLANPDLVFRGQGLQKTSYLDSGKLSSYVDCISSILLESSAPSMIRKFFQREKAL
ncbi:MAG: hypothetical protein NTX49_04550 [Chlamydiae bacterium]|nr:hypothetical protein [Chlamydiota bacterium]